MNGWAYHHDGWIVMIVTMTKMHELCKGNLIIVFCNCVWILDFAEIETFDDLAQ